MDSESGTDSRASPPASWRILVVDDEEADRLSIRRLLESRGHVVAVAVNGSEALQLAASFRPNLVLLDIHLPDISGQEVCGQIRAKPWGKLLAIYAMTGADRYTTIARARGAGFDGFLSKPIDSDVIARLLPQR